MAETLPIIDLLTFFGPLPHRGAPPGTDALRALLERHQVGQAVTLSTRALYYSAAKGNHETRALAAQTPQTLLPAALLDPRVPDAASSLTEARLLALFPATQNYPIHYAPLRQAVRQIARDESRLPLLCEVSRAGDATRITDLLTDAGWRAPLILGPLNGDTVQEEALAVANDAPFSVYLLTAGLRGIGVIRRVADTIGADRILFGSGAPAASLGAAVALVRASGLDTEAQQQIFAQNAHTLLSQAPALQVA